MKKLKFLCSAFLVASLLAIPATAQRVSIGRMGQMHQHNNTDKGKQNPDSSSLAPRDGLSDTRFGGAARKLVVPSSPFHYVVCFWKARAILLDLPRLFLEKIEDSALLREQKNIQCDEISREIL